MSNIICHPYHIVDESPWPLSGQLEDTIIINRILLVFILFFTLFLLSIFFRDKEGKKSKKTNQDSSKGGNNTGGGNKGGKKDPSNFKPRSLAPKSETSPSKSDWDKTFDWEKGRGMEAGIISVCISNFDAGTTETE